MKRKLLIALVVVLAIILVLCLSYLLASAKAQADFVDKNEQSETADTSAISQEDNTATTSPDLETTGNIEQTAFEPTEEMTVPVYTDSTEPTEETTLPVQTNSTEPTEAVATETTAPSVDQTESTEGLDQNELPLVPNS